MTVRIEDLKVGMKVKLVDEIRPGVLIPPVIGKYLGGVYTIKQIARIIDNAIYIEEDKNHFLWDIRLIEKIVDDKERQREKKKNKVYTTLKEIRKESLEDNYMKMIRCSSYTNTLFKFYECIVNNNCVIGLFIDDKRTYKGIAKCHPDDKFDLAKGLTIAMLRAYKDYLDKKIKKLY